MVAEHEKLLSFVFCIKCIDSGWGRANLDLTAQLTESSHQVNMKNRSGGGGGWILFILMNHFVWTDKYGFAMEVSS